jgi:hypothetical protein
MSQKARLGFVCLALASYFFLAREARAQDVDASTKAAARTLGYSGVDAFQRGDYPTASDKLEKAFKTLQIPALGLWSARAREKLGQLVEAAERYREVGTLKPSGGEEDVQKKAMEDSATELKTLLPRIPSVVVLVEGSSPSSGAVTLDGKTLPPALLGEAVPVNPGTHRISARDGARVAEQTFALRESEKRQLFLRLDAAGDAPAAGGAPAPAAAEPARAAPAARPIEPESPRSGSLQRTLGWITVGVGGAALVTGAITGVMAIGKRSSLEGPSCHLDDNVCLTSQQDAVDSYNGLRHVSSIGIIGGVLLGGTGAVLLFTAPKSEQRITLRLGPDGLALRSRF